MSNNGVTFIGMSTSKQALLLYLTRTKSRVAAKRKNANGRVGELGIGTGGGTRRWSSTKLRTGMRRD